MARLRAARGGGVRSALMACKATSFQRSTTSGRAATGRRRRSTTAAGGEGPSASTAAGGNWDETHVAAAARKSALCMTGFLRLASRIEQPPPFAPPYLLTQAAGPHHGATGLRP